jgi:hypothetical protein
MAFSIASCDSKAAIPDDEKVQLTCEKKIVSSGGASARNYLRRMLSLVVVVTSKQSEIFNAIPEGWFHIEQPAAAVSDPVRIGKFAIGNGTRRAYRDQSEGSSYADGQAGSP